MLFCNSRTLFMSPFRDGSTRIRIAIMTNRDRQAIQPSGTSAVAGVCRNKLIGGIRDP